MNNDQPRPFSGLRRLWPVLLVGTALLVGWRLWRRDGATVATQPTEAESAAPDSSRGTRTTTTRPRLRAPSAPPNAALAEHLRAIREKLGSSPTPEEVMAMLQEIARSNPGLAIELADALGQTLEEKTAWVTDLAEQWSRREPQQAWDWLSRLDRTRLFELGSGALPETIIGTIAAGDPNRLLQNLDQLVHAGEGPAGVAPVVAVHLGVEALAANSNPDLARQAVEKWANDPRKPAIGESAYVASAVAMSQTAPDRAAEWIKSMPPSEERDTALVEYPAHWAQKQPKDAMNWAEKNLPPDLRDRGMQRTFGEWVDGDPAAAGQWLADYLSHNPATAITDGMVALMINANPEVRANPAAGLEWTGRLSDPVLRRSYEEKVALRWARQDLAAAIDYITRSPTIPADRKQALLQSINSLAFVKGEEEE